MSYMMEFPPGLLPPNVSSPPYALFAINGVEVFTKDVPDIPLALIIHFAPSIRKWILPEPEPTDYATRSSLRTSYVGINILADINPDAFVRILARMTQYTYLPAWVVPASFRVEPTLLTSVAIHTAWTALELPAKGIEALHAHILSAALIGPPIILLELQALWHAFGPESIYTREGLANFVRNYVDGKYIPAESQPIRQWYLESAERRMFFKSVTNRFPNFESAQKANVMIALGHTKALPIVDKDNDVAAVGAKSKKPKKEPRKDIPRIRKPLPSLPLRDVTDEIWSDHVFTNAQQARGRRRSERVNSIDWNAPEDVNTKTPTSNQPSTIEQSIPVNSTMLAQQLEAMRLERLDPNEDEKCPTTKQPEEVHEDEVSLRVKEMFKNYKSPRLQSILDADAEYAANPKPTSRIEDENTVKFPPFHPDEAVFNREPVLETGTKSKNKSTSVSTVDPQDGAVYLQPITYNLETP